MTHDFSPADFSSSTDSSAEHGRFARFAQKGARRGPGGHGHGPGFAAGFGPGLGRGFGHGPQRARRGDVRSAILSLLAESPANGYGIIKSISEKTQQAWRPSPGSVYPTLQQLVDEGLIASTGEEGRTEFELTDAGRDYATEHADQLANVWNSAGGRSGTDAAFFESVGKLMAVVQQFRFAASDVQRSAAQEKLDETRRALYLILAE